MARNPLICLTIIFILLNICEQSSISVNERAQDITKNENSVKEGETNDIPGIESVVVPEEEYGDNGENGEPEDSVPEDSVPEDSIPEDTEPEDSAPEDAEPEDAEPEDDEPEDAEPEDDEPEDAEPEDAEPEIISTIRTGFFTVNGILLEDIEGARIYSYPTIPYAKAPVGDLRFKDPQPIDVYVGNDLRYDRFCYQKYFDGEIIGDEDCLYLNVYSPRLFDPEAVPVPELLPVMVFIHGGAFVAGNGGPSLFHPRFLLTKDVILVTINYRLGIFGFFNMEDVEFGTPGNAGLKDQRMALQWVQEHIQDFGGNPENVCLFGQSAGAASVHLHVLSPQSEGLFHKAIIQSGAALSPWVLGRSNNGLLLAEELELDTEDNENLLENLQILLAEDIFAAAEAISTVGFDNMQALIGPVVENHAEDDDSTAFLASNPFDIIESGEYNHVPLLIGYTDAEGIFIDQSIRQETGSSQIISDFFDLVPAELEVERDTDESNALALRIQQFYYGGLRPSITNMRPFIKIYTDVMFGFPTYRTALQHAKNDAEPVYLYRFSADTRLNIYKRMDAISAAMPGASHSDDLGYIFYSVGLTPDDLTTEEMEPSNRVIDLWTSFAIHGDDPDQVGLLPVVSNTVNYVDIGTSETVLGVDPDPERMAFWSAIYEEYFRIVYTTTNADTDDTTTELYETTTEDDGDGASLVHCIPMLIAICLCLTIY